MQNKVIGLGERSLRSLRAHWLLMFAFCFVFGLTKPDYVADTTVYAQDAASRFGLSPFWGADRLWESGHVIWRPMGWALLQVFHPLVAPVTGWASDLVVTFLLTAVSVASGVLTVVMWHSLAKRVCPSPAAFMIALSFGCSGAFLGYSHSGAPYVPGLCCLTLSVWILMRNPDSAVSARAAYFSAMAAGFAVVLWLPYVLPVPAVVLLGMAGSPKGLRWEFLFRRERLLFAIRFGIAFFICVGVVYGVAIASCQFSSVDQVRAWALDSGHGWSQNRNVVRLATGLPRSFFSLGKDGVLYKRYFLKDPYWPVTIRELAVASLWKLGVFYLFAAALVFLLLRGREDRWAFWLLASGAAPVLFFAVVLFEPGSAERYFPFFPFLILAVAVALRNLPQSRSLPTYIVAGFLVSMALANVHFMFRSRIERQDAPRLERALAVKTRLNENGFLAVLSNQDPFYASVCRNPFHPVNQPPKLALYDILQVASLRVLSWRREFASKVSQAWSAGGDVWVSKRLWESVPRQDSHWVEGDDPRISWKQVPEFFRALDTDAEVGGEDGFVRLKKGESNFRLLADFSVADGD